MYDTLKWNNIIRTDDFTTVITYGNHNFKGFSYKKSRDIKVSYQYTGNMI